MNNISEMRATVGITSNIVRLLLLIRAMLLLFQLLNTQVILVLCSLKRY